MMKSRALTVTTLVVVAVAAGLLGAAADRAYLSRARQFVGDTTFHPISSALRAPTDADRKRMRLELSTALSLNADQNRVVDSILDSRAGEFDRLRDALRPRVDSLIGAVRKDIDRVLTPEQQAKYRDIQAASARGGSAR